MLSHLCSKLSNIWPTLISALSGRHLLAFLPAFVLVGFWLGGEILLVAVALGFPFFQYIFQHFLSGNPNQNAPHFAEFGGNNIHKTLDGFLAETRKTNQKTACFLIEIDDFHAIHERYGQQAAEDVMSLCAKRLQSAIRTRDQVIPLPIRQIGVATAPVKHLNLETCLQMASRFQAAVEEPIALDTTTIYLSVSVGFCMTTDIASPSGKSLVDSATLALREALRHGPSALRAYSQGMGDFQACPHLLADEIKKALDAGQFQAWYQPQISTDTGQVTGFEALARWMHPDHGMIAPIEFLPAIEASGSIERLGEVMLFQALTALSRWDQLGFNVPHIGVNFSSSELQNPRLVEKIEWQLDRFELKPDRLAVEILETVIGISPKDMVTRNISALATLGCLIDLDDFGTGHASISSIRRFAVQRLKIDRSFVLKIDQDPEQQRMVSAILVMSESLGLDSLAEGVESAGEHAMLAQLGCRHVQGFGIGRPMPFDMTADWMNAHLSKLSKAPTIGRHTG
ncbi:Cyclic di-GMP phosphodiesterase Gmr [Roseovarius litorisediminis]|uniref:Cyclic di-GMP phosphodiesterase Gmr n=1 Tax=Roseovarius litorisediminis TaxID=1312363 RepID=A0A1Y5RPH7_9RHOB|nr:Cyclic di-GMP phosphodiesterase Gmr [Roseovarius litorisediminis]